MRDIVPASMTEIVLNKGLYHSSTYIFTLSLQLSIV